MSYSEEHIKRGIEAMYRGGDTVEMRVPKGGKKGTISGYFNDFDMLAAEIARHSGQYEGIYCTMNPVDPALLSRAHNRTKEWMRETTTDSQIVRRRHLCLDFDPVRPAGISSTEQEKSSAKVVALEVRKFLTEQEWPLPQPADSGNGYHLQYAIDLPNDEESRKLVEDCLFALAAKFDTDQVKIDCKMFNASRIIKAYGSMACKGDSTEERPHRLSRLLDPGGAVTTVPREMLQRIAAMRPQQKKTGAGKGPWSEEDARGFIQWAPLASVGEPMDFKGGIKWQHDCPNNSDHRKPDAFTSYVDGWLNVSCSHNSCKDMSQDDWIALLEEEKGEPCPFPRRKSIEELVEASRLQVEDADIEGKTEGASADFPPNGSPEKDTVRMEIDRIMRLPSRGEDAVPAREKNRAICQVVLKHMLAHGKLYNCGNVAVYLDNGTREAVEVVRGGRKFLWLMSSVYGILPTEERMLTGIGQHLGAYADHSAPKTTIRLLSWYDRERHILYCNEYRGSVLRIGGDGKVERIRSGDDGVLFSDGEEVGCEPLVADIGEVPLARGLRPEEDSLLTKYVLDTILYSEDGIGRENSHIILTLCVLSLFFHERVMSNPFVYIVGPGGSMKTSVAVKVGRIIMGPDFRVTPSTDDDDNLKLLAMTVPFLVLDEANNMKKMDNAIKAIATGAEDRRRELYTTVNMRVTPYQARTWMTVNTGSLNETVSSRMMILDAAERTEVEPYRAEHYLRLSKKERDDIWTEIVGRLTSVMRSLAAADAAGEGDISVSHRMSSFFVMGRTVARREGWEEDFLEAMNAMGERQTGAAAESNDIAYVISRLGLSYNLKSVNGKMEGYRTAEEWAELLPYAVPAANVELSRKCARPGWVRYQFKSNQHVLEKVCGMQISSTTTSSKNRIKLYGFTKCAGHGDALLHDLDEDVLPKTADAV